ncbi:MAG: hypothetical protein ABJF10_11075 [Chthoniobacter sp.]|uniref:hypothetical protein n=1 Tax=Chthoniobacter sp. TaxID=2510640 RepID=UPI0032A47230
MNRTFLSTICLCTFICGTAYPASPPTPAPTEVCDIVTVISRFQIPRIDFQKPTTLKEALNFIYRKYEDVDGDPRPTNFVFDVRLSEATLQRRVSFQAKDVTMIQALNLALTNVPVALTFEPGKVIFTPLPPSVDASSPTRNP